MVTRFRSHGTHKGGFQGLAPTGKRVEIAEVAIYRIENGKIGEQWGIPRHSRLAATAWPGFFHGPNV